jgi:hypothetical protein
VCVWAQKERTTPFRYAYVCLFVAKSTHKACEISSSHGGEYEVKICLLGCTAVQNNCRPTFQRYVLPPLQGALMMEAARNSETSVDNYFTRQYIPEDKSELRTHKSFIRVSMNIAKEALSKSYM